MKTTKPLALKGTPPMKMRVYRPTRLPSSPVFTTRGWFNFDKWGRVQKVEPQPAQPDHYDSLFSLPEYRELRESFLFLPPYPMLTDTARKKKTTLAKHKMKSFFLPYKEKRMLEIREICEKRTKKLTKKQKQKELESSAAFAKAFSGTDEASDEASGIPGPPTDESESDSEFEWK